MLACHTSTNAQLHLCSKTSLTLDYLLRLSRSIQEISLAKYELNSLYTRTSIATRQLWDCPRYTKTEERWTQVIHNNRSWRQLSSITIMERHADPCPVEPKDPDHYWELGDISMRATSLEIRKAYLHLSHRTHPDKLPPDASDAKFKKVGAILLPLTRLCSRKSKGLYSV
jgi:hypothetical protein